MSCHCGYDRCTCERCCSGIQSECCKCNSKKGLYVKTVNHGDVVNNIQGGSVYKAFDRFSVPVCGEEGVLVAEGELLNPPYNAYVYISKGDEIARLRILGTTVYNGSLENCGNSCGCDDEPVLVNANEMHRFCGKTVTEIKVVNDCPECSSENQLSPGTFLNSGFTFMIQAPACNESGGTGSASGDLVLCDKVHGVAVGDEQTIEVSPSTSTLSINDIIQIQDKRFRVTDIPSPTTITIINDGEGGAIGDVIDGCDCESVRIFRIAGDDPCNKTAVEFGQAAIVCEDGQLKPVILEEGEVLGKKNDVVQGIIMPTDDTPRTTFQGCIVLNPAADPQEYVLIVDDATGFAVYDIVFFDCDSEQRKFSVVNIDGSNLTLVPSFEVTSVEPVADSCENCRLVKADCCEQCPDNGTIEEYRIAYCFNADYENNEWEKNLQLEFLEDDQAVAYDVTSVTNTAGEGSTPLCDRIISNDTGCPALVEITVLLTESHFNVNHRRESGSNVYNDNTQAIKARYTFNLIDCETDEVIGNPASSPILAFGGSQQSDAFPTDLDFNWGTAGGNGGGGFPALWGNLGGLTLSYSLELQPGEQFAFYLKIGTAVCIPDNLVKGHPDNNQPDEGVIVRVQNCYEFDVKIRQTPNKG